MMLYDFRAKMIVRQCIIIRVVEGYVVVDFVND